MCAYDFKLKYKVMALYKSFQRTTTSEKDQRTSIFLNRNRINLK